MSALPAGAIRSTIPARLDRLQWSPFHTRMVFGINAEEKSLEDVTRPLTSTAERGSGADSGAGPAGRVVVEAAVRTDQSAPIAQPRGAQA